MIKGQIVQWIIEKGQRRIYKTLHRKIKIEQHEPNYKSEVNSGGGSVIQSIYVTHDRDVRNITNVEGYANCFEIIIFIIFMLCRPLSEP